MGCLVNIFWWAVTIAVAIGQYLKQQEKAAQEERDRQFHRDHPEAKARSKPEARLKRLVTDMFPGQCECEYCPPWLQGLRIDAAVPAHRLAFEYNGRQHYEFTEYFHETHGGFRRQRERDDRKAQLLRQHGWTLIVVSYKEKDSLGEGYLLGRLRQVGVATPPPASATAGRSPSLREAMGRPPGAHKLRTLHGD